MTVDGQSSVESPETESLEDIIRMLLPTPVRPASEGGPHPVGQGSPHSVTNGSDSPITAGGAGTIEIDRFGDHVTELASGWSSHGRGCCFAELAVGFSLEGCFSCGVLTHTTDQCQTLDESFPFLPKGWQADHIGDQYILGPGPQALPPSQQMGNAD